MITDLLLCVCESLHYICICRVGGGGEGRGRVISPSAVFNVTGVQYYMVLTASLKCMFYALFHTSDSLYATCHHAVTLSFIALPLSLSAELGITTPYATSFRRRFFVYHHTMKHLHTNI